MPAVSPGQDVIHDRGRTRLVMDIKSSHRLKAVRENDGGRLRVGSDTRNLGQLVGKISVHRPFTATHIHVAKRRVVDQPGVKSMVPIDAARPWANLTAVRKQENVTADDSGQIRDVGKDRVVVMKSECEVVLRSQIVVKTK